MQEKHKTQIQSLGGEDPLDGNPLQCSCLENPMDTQTWWATVHEATESDTTKQLSIHTFMYFYILCIYI